ncbi:MAG: S-formylglutathione hydrolase [Sandaracinaceae bacterium]|jgi:S-formylglutathione hydrolase|nr:S-formylglutathione hydrolase [Sandaracinaceae bacterium]
MLKKIEGRASFGGVQEVWTHGSETLHCEMKFAIYLPPQIAKASCPVLYFLSGLTCNEQNFITKAGAQRYASEHGVVLVVPDTSPRGRDVPDDPAYDLGQGASFYLNATQAPWSTHFKMYDYLTAELPSLIEKNFSVSKVRGICGHSMGGHGALVIALTNADVYHSVSALSPIVAPMSVPWGQKAFAAYLGENQDTWRAWDACELVRLSRTQMPILIDQGSADEFLDSQLQPELFVAACNASARPLTLNMRVGYDHSYYFIASFIGDHIAHHARAFNA